MTTQMADDPDTGDRAVPAPSAARSHPPSTTLRRATRVLQVLLVTTLLISIVHYTDNTVRWSDYEQGQGGPVPRWLVPLSWVGFVAAGIGGYVAFRRRRWGLAAGLLGACSVSGLISPAHYTSVSPSDFSVFQNAFVALDTLSGVALLGFALWLALTAPRL
jgi:hypothetical protein